MEDEKAESRAYCNVDERACHYTKTDDETYSEADDETDRKAY